MAYSFSIARADVKQPIEDVIVILGVYSDFVCAIEDGGGFGVYEATGTEEGCIGWCRPGRVAAMNETFLQRVGVPAARSTLGVIVFGFS